MAGTLRDAGFDVSFIDAVGESLDTRHPVENDCYLYGLNSEQTIERIPEDVDVIGIHAGFSFEWPYCRSLIADIRRRFPETPLIGGGEHVTAMPEASMAESALDIGVLGEGEETMLEVSQALAAGNLEPALIAGIVFRDGAGTIAVTGRRGRRRDMAAGNLEPALIAGIVDAISRPAWDLLPIEAYLERGFGFGVNRGRSMPVLGSRGCPYQCTFCSSPQMWTTRWIARDPDLLLDELADYQRDYNAENFDFYDLTAIVKKSWIVDFCRKIEERGMKFTWQLPSGTRSEAIDGEVAELLYRSGCRNLSYSPESGSEAVLARIKKRIKTERMIESMESCRAEGINIKCNIMLGFPGETLKEVFESYRFIARMALAGTYDLSIWAFSPYPGSELFEQLFEAGRIKVDDAYYDSLRSYADASRTKSYSENISDATLKALRFGELCLFYGVQWLRRPLRPFRMIWNVWRGNHESRAEMGLANLLRRGQLTSGAD